MGASSSAVRFNIEPLQETTVPSIDEDNDFTNQSSEKYGHNKSGQDKNQSNLINTEVNKTNKNEVFELTRDSNSSKRAIEIADKSSNKSINQESKVDFSNSSDKNKTKQTKSVKEKNSVQPFQNVATNSESGNAVFSANSDKSLNNRRKPLTSQSSIVAVTKT
ncbi:uncharacterized protein LOC143253460 [Tachypleus tridentatus]|uniref:uncharacterized protein LOC143253460 n=1 Tax=Tachypleus tridentatus TaxID=6853 RepID=UPI003FCF62BE